MDIADDKNYLRIIHKLNKDVTPLFGQFAAYMMKLNTTFGLIQKCYLGPSDFFSKTKI